MLVLSGIFFLTVALPAQTVQKPAKKTKAERLAEQAEAFSKIEDLINTRQFVFQAEFNQGSDMIFVVVDSVYGEVQNGNRNNLQGKITEYEVEKDKKGKNLSVSIKMRGDIYTSDVFLFIGPYGDGRATVRGEFPGYFSFDGKVVDFENAQIYEGRSHFIK